MAHSEADYRSPVCINAFATLTPDNTITKRGFDAVSKAVRASPEELSSLSRYMHIDDAAETYSPLPIFSDSETDRGSPDHPEEKLEWGGHYAICLCKKHIPSVLARGWTVGYGNHRMRDGGVDFRLAMARSRPSALAAWHAQFQFNKDGLLALGVFKDGRRITLSGSTFTIGASVLRDWSPTNIQFGEFGYTLQMLDIVGTTEWRMEYERFIKRIGGKLPPDFVSPIPSPMDHILGNWCITENIASGSSGTVSAAKHFKTGSLMAVKRYNRKTQRKTFENEIRMLQILPTHDRLVRYVDQFQESGKDGWVYLFMSPLAYFTLGEIKNGDDSVYGSILQQVLQGIDALHQVGIVHRDIKPRNIGVAGSNPITIFIFDFDCAIQLGAQDKIQPQRGQVGTREYLAPEMEEQPYNSKVDVWSCGVIGARLLFYQGRIGQPWSDIVAITHMPQESAGLRGSYCLPPNLLPRDYQNKPETRWLPLSLLRPNEQYERVQRVLPRITTALSTSIQHLIGQLLQCDPEKRPSAAEALHHPYFVHEDRPKPVSSTVKVGDKRPLSLREDLSASTTDFASIHSSLFSDEETSSDSKQGVTNVPISWRRLDAAGPRPRAMLVGGGSHEYSEDNSAD